MAATRLSILLDETLGTISPYLHGHFAEHLGELVYDGVCVPPDSPIPNTGGIRNDVVEALQGLQIPVLRWPGGCFADDYHWRDGIGPIENRPLRVNRHWGMAEEPNWFGTHEFMEFCRALDATPYFAGNLGSGTPKEMRDWVEYCNFGGNSTLAQERRTNGAQEPFGVKYWGVGNENWGCGGDMSPEAYAEAYSRYRSYLSDYPDGKGDATRVFPIACGPDNSDWAWTRRFFTYAAKYYACRTNRLGAFAAHYYCGTAGTATQYTDSQWLELLAKAVAVEGIIVGHRAIMDEFDPERKIKLILDEWGAWHPVEEGKHPGGLYQQNTVRDACVAALSLDIFNAHCDKLWMANIAQLINVLQACLLVHEDKVIKTPTYHVFEMYLPHRDAQSVRVMCDGPAISDGEASQEWCQTRYLERRSDFALRHLHASASVKDGVLCITATNPHPTASIEIDLEVRGGALDAAEVLLLAHDDIRAHNTFETPDTVTLSTPRQVSLSSERVTVPPGGVVRIMGKLG